MHLVWLGLDCYGYNRAWFVNDITIKNIITQQPLDNFMNLQNNALSPA